MLSTNSQITEPTRRPKGTFFSYHTIKTSQIPQIYVGPYDKCNDCSDSPELMQEVSDEYQGYYDDSEGAELEFIYHYIEEHAILIIYQSIYIPTFINLMVMFSVEAKKEMGLSLFVRYCFP